MATYGARENLRVGRELENVLERQPVNDCSSCGGLSYITDLEEHAFEVRELRRSEPQQTDVVVEHSAGGGLVRLQGVCALPVIFTLSRK